MLFILGWLGFWAGRAADQKKSGSSLTKKEREGTLGKEREGKGKEWGEVQGRPKRQLVCS